MVRAQLNEGSYFVEEKASTKDVKAYSKRNCCFVHLFIAHSQKAEDMAVFLYNVLDVPVAHAFFLDMRGDLNMKNFQRFESKAKSESLTILNTSVKVLDLSGYESLRTLILVSCGLSKLTELGSLKSLELLDVRNNKLETIPESIKDCLNLRTLRLANNSIKRLPKDLGQLNTKLKVIDVSNNFLKRLGAHLVTCSALQTLQCNNNQILDLPVDIGLLRDLEDLILHNNNISILPLSVASLPALRRITFHSNPLQNIPVDFPERAGEVRSYLQTLQDDPVPNRTVKLVLVGQEGVGKSSLLKAIKRTFWMLPKTPTTHKTDGIEIKDIVLDDLTLRCFDCGGDVDFNETHNFFITHGALYLACFNLAEYTISTVERASFLLGRLQLWLQYIFTKVPAAQVLIIGTHADNSSLSNAILEQIWNQLRAMLDLAQKQHTAYFTGRDRQKDCLLCQGDLAKVTRCSGPGSTGFVNPGIKEQRVEDDVVGGADPETGKAISFPHIIGYYEVSSTRALGAGLNFSSNPTVELVKDAIRDAARRIIRQNPKMPRRWANVQQSLQNKVQQQPDDCAATFSEVAQIAAVQGVHEKSELVNMLQFFKAQGNLLFFPQVEDLDNLVILDPEWLAKVFSKVVSYRDTGISHEGFIEVERLREIWADMDSRIQNKILILLHHFGLCLAVPGSSTEFFPCRLPIGEPDDAIWPQLPPAGVNQVTYSVTFPSMIPPPFFSDLIVAVYKQRCSNFDRDGSCQYFATQMLDNLLLDRVGCRDCNLEVKINTLSEKQLVHQVHFELIAYKRVVQVTVRGSFTCCMMKRVARLVNRVVRKFEGLGTIELDALVCPGCVMQKSRFPHKFSAKALLNEASKTKTKLICPNAHILPDNTKMLMGVVHDSCVPNATIRVKSAKEKADYSGCPKLFIVLPVNNEGVSFDRNLRLFVNSLVMDGYAAHLLCEMPDGYHLTRAPGYRLRKPKLFMQQFGSHVVNVLRLLSHSAKLSVVSPQHSQHSLAVTGTIDELLNDIKHKFSFIKEVHSSSKMDVLVNDINSKGKKFKRDDLKVHLGITDKADIFGPLRRLKYGDKVLWLCNEHYKQLRMLSMEATESTVESQA